MEEEEEGDLWAEREEEEFVGRCIPRIGNSAGYPGGEYNYFYRPAASLHLPIAVRNGEGGDGE